MGESSTLNSVDTFIFDSEAPSESGGEKYQATRVRLCDVWVSSPVDWSTDTYIEVTDGTRTFSAYLGLNSGFDGTELFTAGEHFDVVGIMDQKVGYGEPLTVGYRLLVMNADDLTAVISHLTGDANGDGIVSAGDYSSVQANFGNTGAPGILGDANGDGVVSAGDYASVQANFGNVASGATSVPEPVTIGLISFGVFVVIRSRRRAC